jgi:hypothetical protein
MTGITDAMRTDFREQGFVVVPDVLTGEQVALGRKVVAALLAEKPHAEDHVGAYFLWPVFDQDGGGHRLLDLYRQAGIGELASQLIRADLTVDEPDFAQVATTIPPWPHRPGGPHVDGLTPPSPDGTPATFTMLAGLWLTDQAELNRGNLWIWPGTHLRFGEYLAEHGADALTRLDAMNPGPYPKIELGEPIQASGSAGSVLFAHYLLAHNIGGHDGTAEDDRRETIYYRLQTAGHRTRWRDAVTNPLTEFRIPE